MASNSVPPPPTWPETYSGIPGRLLGKATAVKINTAALQTVGIVPRKRDLELPVIPKGYSRSRFLEAIKSISSNIGEQNVALNVKPLDDGW